jgi:hypothetical protein
MDRRNRREPRGRSATLGGSGRSAAERTHRRADQHCGGLVRHYTSVDQPHLPGACAPGSGCDAAVDGELACVVGLVTVTSAAGTVVPPDNPVRSPRTTPPGPHISSCRRRYDDDQVGHSNLTEAAPTSRGWGHSNLRFLHQVGPLKPDIPQVWASRRRRCLFSAPQFEEVGRART